MNFLNLSNACSVPFTFCTIWRNVRKQREYIRRELEKDIQQLRLFNDKSLSESDFIKITDYYAMGVPSILGEALCALRGKLMDNNERATLTYLGALTGLFDDFFDRKGLSEAKIQNMINNPNTMEGANDNEKLFLQFYNKALGGVVNTEQLKRAFFSVYLAQVESKKQFRKEIGRNEILNITLKKGGESLIFYRKALPYKLEENEEAMLYTLGGLMQLGNDIFDVYKDYQSGIQTLVTAADTIDSVKAIFFNLLFSLYSHTAHLNYPKSNIDDFIRMISLGISRCFVCLNQLERLERRTGDKFLLSAYSRTDLICDMEKPANIIKSIMYHIKYCNAEIVSP